MGGCTSYLRGAGDLLNLPSHVMQQAALLLSGKGRATRCQERVAVAIYLASRSLGLPLSTREICEALGISGGSFSRALWKANLRGDASISARPLTDEEWIPQLVQKMGLPPSCEKRALAISQSLRLTGLCTAASRRRAMLSAYLAGLEAGTPAVLSSLSRRDRLWLMSAAGFGKSYRPWRSPTVSAASSRE
ncbi:MAG: hypothetical protein ACP5UI_04645 [Thermoprotei archaeon]|nr:hypothetical protein [TACK group archaeon]